MKQKHGFTIIELLIYMGILTIFLVVMTEIFLSSLDVQLSSEATSAVSQDGRFILARLAHDVGRAETITMPSSLGGTANTLQILIDGITYTYDVAGGVFTLTNNFGTNPLQSYSSSVSGFTVTRLGNVDGKESARMGFTITSETGLSKGPETRTFETTVGVR